MYSKFKNKMEKLGVFEKEDGDNRTISIEEKLAQQQLDAYNNHDIEGFIICYSEDVEIYNLTTNELRMRGHEEMRSRYGKLFENKNRHAKLVNRMVMKNKVVDHEFVTGLEDGSTKEAIAIYEVENELICRVWFL